MLATRPARVDGSRRSRLDIYAEQPANLGDEIGQRKTESAAQPGQFTTQRGDAPIAFPGIASGRARITDRVGQTGGVGDLFPRRGVPAIVVELLRAPPQGRDVAAAEAPPRTGENPHRRGPGGRIGDKSQHRNNIGDLGDIEQSGQSDNLDGHAPGSKCLGHRRRIRVAPHQHRCRRWSFATAFGVVVPASDMAGHPLAFGPHVVEKCAHDGAGGRAGPGTQGAHPHRSAAGLG